jgi:hypothetical protein
MLDEHRARGSSGANARRMRGRRRFHGQKNKKGGFRRLFRPAERRLMPG